MGLQSGDWVVYRPSRHPPSLRLLRVSYATSMIEWDSLDSSALSRMFRSRAREPIKALVRAEPGTRRQVVMRQFSPRNLTDADGADESFSLVFAPLERYVTFVARTVDERDKWVRSFNELAVGIFNVQHVAHVSPLFQWSTSGNAEQEFEVGDLIGAGSYAEVYRGRHRPTQFPVAIKIVHQASTPKARGAGRPHLGNTPVAGSFRVAGDELAPQAGSPMALPPRSKSLQDQQMSSALSIDAEERLLLKCRHANVVTYFGSLHDSQGRSAGVCALTSFALTTCGGRLWMLTELCEAGSILDVLMRTPVRLTEKQIATILRATLSGLEYLHKSAVVHCDVKCSNVLMNGSAQVKLADFGVSKQIDAETIGRKKGVGTLLWMAPEVMNGARNSTASDIWSLGITTLELANDGKAPFCDDSLPDALAKLRSGTVPTLANDTWSPAFHDFVRTCLATNPKLRPNASQLLQHPFLSQRNACAPLNDLIADMFKRELHEQIKLVDDQVSVRENLDRFGNGGVIRKSAHRPRPALNTNVFGDDPGPPQEEHF